MRARVLKYEAYPADTPTGFAIGYSVQVEGHSFYEDTVLTLDEIADKSEDEILHIAWNKLENRIMARAGALSKAPPIVGSEWLPLHLRDLEIVEDTEDEHIPPDADIPIES